MFVEAVTESKQRGIKNYPVHTNRASDLGHPCLRYLVLSRTKWRERSLHDVGLQYIFDLGNEIERIAIRELEDAGFRIIEQQRTIEVPEYQITAHPDGKILANGVAYPLDIKSSSPHIFDSISSIADLEHSRYLHLRKYPTQLTIYLMDDKGTMQHERGLFVFKNKVSGRMKEIWMDWNDDFANSILSKAATVNKHIAEGTTPEPCEYDEEICGKCPFAHICLRDRVGQAVEVIDAGKLSAMIDRMNELSPAAKEHAKLSKELATALEGRSKLICGDYYIDGKWCERKGFIVGASKYWLKSIVKLKENGNAGRSHSK